MYNIVVLLSDSNIMFAILHRQQYNNKLQSICWINLFRDRIVLFYTYNNLRSISNIEQNYSQIEVLMSAAIWKPCNVRNTSNSKTV